MRWNFIKCVVKSANCSLYSYEQNLTEHIFNTISHSIFSVSGIQLSWAVIKAKSLVELKKGFKKLCEQRQHLQLYALDYNSAGDKQASCFNSTSWLLWGSRKNVFLAWVSHADLLRCVMGWFESSLKGVIMIMNAIVRLFASQQYWHFHKKSIKVSLQWSPLPSKGLIWRWWQQNSNLGYDQGFFSGSRELAYSLITWERQWMLL